MVSARALLCSLSVTAALACAPQAPEAQKADAPRPADAAAPPAPAPAEAKPAETKSRRKELARGKEAKLEKPPEAVRKAFWAAVQAGRAQTAKKDYAAAIASFDEALKQLPDHPRALSGRGYARLLAGELDAAEADLRRALAAPGTKKLESAIAFNLGLVAEKRGDQALARAQFSLANTLNPSKAAAAKLTEGPACPVELKYGDPESQLYSSWSELWRKLVDEGVVDGEKPPADEAAAKAIVCTSEALVESETATFDACARTPGGPWLVKHYFEWGGHALFVIEPADAGQLRMTNLGMAGGGRCGALSEASITGDNPAVVTWQVQEFVSIDVMENASGEIVPCEGDADCFSACGEEIDAHFGSFVFSSRTADPTAVRGPLVEGADFLSRPVSTVTVEGSEIVVSGGGCQLRAPLVAPRE